MGHKGIQPMTFGFFVRSMAWSGCFSCLVLFAGCAEEEPEPVYHAVEKPSRVIFPIMFDHQRASYQGETWILTTDEIANLKVEELSEKQPDSTFTAVISFDTSSGTGDASGGSSSGRPAHLKVEVKFEVNTLKIRGGHEILQYPIRELKVLAVDEIAKEPAKSDS